MKITFIALIAICALNFAASEYRYKHHMHPRPPHPPIFSKKWAHNPPGPPPPPRGPPHRSNRPIPVFMPAPYKIPMGASPKGPRLPISPPVRNFWKNTQNVLRSPQVVNKEKPFVSSPPIKSQDDYRIQANGLSGLYNTVKQVGEKGPIHTIPAPNLSPADKPEGLESVSDLQNFNTEVKQHQYLLQQQSKPELLQQHQYQVIESQEPSYFNSGKYTASKEFQAPFQKAEAAAVTPQQPQQVSFNFDGFSQEQKINPEQIQTSLSPNELVQLFGDVAQQDQQLLSYQEIFGQKKPNYNFDLQQQPQMQTQVLIQPEFHSFNYQEQDYQKGNINFDLETSADSSHSIVARNPNKEALAQTQYVQNYFNNNNTPETSTENNSEKNPKEELLSSAYYSSLPNKKAAEALATLQAAGKLNNNMMEITMKGTQKVEGMRIYVPDEETNDVVELDTEASRKQDDAEQLVRQDSEEFGSRVRTN